MALSVPFPQAAAMRGRLQVVARDPALATASVLLGLVLLAALVGPLVWRQDPLAVNLGDALQAPSWAHPMGTDASGRDMLARFDRGAGISLLSAIVVVVLAAVVGGAAGLLSGLGSGRVDAVVMRVMDAILAFPSLVLAMAVSIGLGPGLVSGVIGVALTCVPFYARLLRTDVLRIRSLPHVEAAHAIGVPPHRIVARHILPHALPTMLVQSAAVFGTAILTLAGLGFVGLGAQIPTPEWGAMITDGLQYALTGQWWISTFPGVGVLLCVVGANLLADRARDLLDPRGPLPRS